MSIFAVLAAGAVLAQAYTWVDENGVVHYSDRPQEGAIEIQLPRDPRPASPPAARTPASAGSQQQSGTESSGPFSYESITISSPAPEETLWNIEGVLNVTLNVQPALQANHRVRVYFDGNPQMVSGSSFQIQEVYRGEHNLQAEILDETGRLMARSQPNRFYVQQNSIIQN